MREFVFAEKRESATEYWLSVFTLFGKLRLKTTPMMNFELGIVPVPLQRAYIAALSGCVRVKRAVAESNFVRKEPDQHCHAANGRWGPTSKKTSPQSRGITDAMG
ncbi:MAG: hypothetical protein WCQ89_09330 [Verrucomicrobiota bacterium]